MWKIEKVVSKGDYKYAIVREHPNRTKNDYVLLHRVIMENHLGKLLNSEEVVHHKDQDKNNNDISNLEVMDRKKHNKLHGSLKPKKYAKLKCPVCNKIFERLYRQTHLVKKHAEQTCCSRTCGTKLGRFKQLNRITPEMKVAISENVLAIYKKL